MMADPTGESAGTALKLDFDRRPAESARALHASETASMHDDATHGGSHPPRVSPDQKPFVT
jgi:hypothetical protein